jgi:TonB family protein
MNHELVHVNEKHWLDHILIEILRLVQWINPFVWLYTRFIKQNQEHIADEMMLQQTTNPVVYKAVLVNQLFDSRVISLTNSFNYSLNKQRFDMMIKIATSPYRKMKMLLVLPVFAIIFYAFATPEYHYKIPVDISKNINQAEPSVTDVDQNQQKSTVKIRNSDGSQTKPLIVIDGVISKKAVEEIDGATIYSMSVLKDLAATEKYGEKGANGIMELTTRKKALELGLKPEMFPRLAPEDYPTFQNQKWTSFRGWVTDNVKYPSEATAQKIEGWVTVNFSVELDGTISNPKVMSTSIPVLGNEVIRVIKTAPKWDAPKNPAVDLPFTSSVNVGFKLPDQIVKEEPFVVVEEMPMYSGGEGELLKFIAENTKYPEAAKTEKIQGKVIIRFIVNTEGNTEGISVLKGVHPLLDAEAVRVVSMFSGFKPGMQGGKAVPVWYMVPINFALPITN